jgi:hypothetical protein
MWGLRYPSAMLLESSPPSDALPEGLLDQARLKLLVPDHAEKPWAALLAAAFFALSALVFASAAILAPPLKVTPAAKTGVR